MVLGGNLLLLLWVLPAQAGDNLIHFHHVCESWMKGCTPLPLLTNRGDTLRVRSKPEYTLKTEDVQLGQIIPTSNGDEAWLQLLPEVQEELRKMRHEHDDPRIALVVNDKVLMVTTISKMFSAESLLLTSAPGYKMSEQMPWLKKLKVEYDLPPPPPPPPPPKSYAWLWMLALAAAVAGGIGAVAVVRRRRFYEKLYRSR